MSQQSSEQNNDPSALHKKTSDRVITAAFGVMFALAGLGLLTLTLADPAPLSMQMQRGAVVLGLIIIGGQAVWASWRKKPSWLSKIGPLP